MSHDDLIARLREPCIDWTGEPIVDGSTPRTEVHRGLLREAAYALSSQSLSLSEAREENDRKDAEIERLKGLVAGIRETPAPAWQPIGTSEGDEAYVLVWDGWHVSEARYHPSEDGWWLANTHPTDAHDGQIYPTHWMPIPAPPLALENGPAGLADATNDPASSDLSSLRKGAEVDMVEAWNSWWEVRINGQIISKWPSCESAAIIVDRIRSALVSGSREEQTDG